MRSRVKIHAKRVVVLPGDVKTSRLTNDVAAAVRLALFAGGFVLGRIPLISDTLTGFVQGDAGIITFGRRDPCASANLP